MRYLAILFVGLLAYATYWVNLVFQPFKTIEVFRDDSCVYLETPEGNVEDITYTSEGVGIGSISDKMSLSGLNSQSTPQGGFVAVMPEPFAYHLLPIIGFPSEVNLQPHGVFLFQEKWLYAVNYAHSRGGQRVEVFELVKSPEMSLKYHRSILFGDEYMGTLNDLVVLEEGELYVSVWLPIPKERGTGHLGLIPMLRILFEWTFLRHTSVIRCDVKTALELLDEDGFTEDSVNAVCNVELKGMQMNGITTDGVDVFVADVSERQVIRLKREATTGSLVEIERIDVNSSLDNVEFHKPSGRIYGGGLGSVAAFMKFKFFGAEKCPGTAVEIKQQNGKWVSEEILTLDGIKTVSTASRWAEYVSIGVFSYDKKIGRCKLW
jgi:hypothetical protein